MDLTQGIYWHQGMFMQPQHFQLAALHTQFCNKPVVETALPYFWGAGQLDISASALCNQVIEVRAAQLIFPDRTYVEYPGNAVLAPRRFDPNQVGQTQTLTVYLGIHKLARAGNNVTLCQTPDEAAAATSRYASLAAPPEVPDLYSDGPPAPVHRLWHVVKVFFEYEIANLAHYDLLPIAQLVRTGDAVVASAHFIAPSYALTGSSTLLHRVREMSDHLAARAHHLQALKRPYSQHQAEAEPADAVFLLALQTLLRACPYLVHVTQTPSVHPWVVYGMLRQLVGELSLFSARFDMLGQAHDGALGLPAYDHLNLHECFARAQRVLDQLLSEMTVGPEHVAILERRDALFVGALPAPFFARPYHFYLILHAAQLDAPLLEQVRCDARLASVADMARLGAYALPGLELTYVPQAPPGVPRRSGAHYFQIEQSDARWQAVKREASIALQWLEAPPDLHVEIVALRSQRATD